MEKILCLMLKSETFTALPLLIADSHEIDKFTSKKFENQEQILEHYAKQINFFLESNKIKIEEYQNQHKKKIPWKLAVLEKRASYNNEISYIERSVLYKKHVNSYVVKELLSNKIILPKLLNTLNYLNIEGSFIKDLIFRKRKVKKDIDVLYTELTKQKDYYTIARGLHNAYRGYLLYNDGPTVEEIYSKVSPSNTKTNELDKVYKNISYDQMQLNTNNPPSYEQDSYKAYR